jgi:signal recognition particle subunit SRP54
MFDTLARGFRQAKNRLAGLTELTEQNIDPALREVRLSAARGRRRDRRRQAVPRAGEGERPLGQTVHTSRVKHEGQSQALSASDIFVKICHDELDRADGHDGERAPHVRGERATGIMMVGLQGSGKTTTAPSSRAKLEKQGKKPLLVAADMQRPAAVEQLKVLGAAARHPVFNLKGGKTPVEICAAARAEAKKLGRDVVIYDTAGRLAIDEALMHELAQIKAKTSPRTSTSSSTR